MAGLKNQQDVGSEPSVATYQLHNPGLLSQPILIYKVGVVRIQEDTLKEPGPQHTAPQTLANVVASLTTMQKSQRGKLRFERGLHLSLLEEPPLGV